MLGRGVPKGRGEGSYNKSLTGHDIIATGARCELARSHGDWRGQGRAFRIAIVAQTQIPA